MLAEDEPPYRLNADTLLRSAKRARLRRRVGLLASASLTALAISIVSVMLPHQPGGPTTETAGPELGMSAPDYPGSVPPGARLAVSSATGPCGDGELFGVDGQGDLRRYTVVSRPGSCEANVGPGQVIDDGWRGVRQIFADQDTIYALTASGDIRWYRYDPANASWAAGSSGVISSGWAGFRQVTYAGDGVFYVIDGDGMLRWYRHLDRIGGSARWADGSGRAIDDGWASAHQIFAALGTIYASTATGDLRWYRYSDPLHGNGNWQSRSGLVVDSGGWDTAVAAVAAWNPDRSAVVIYTIGSDGLLRRLTHTTPNTGTDSWAVGPSSVIGANWLN